MSAEQELDGRAMPHLHAFRVGSVTVVGDAGSMLVLLDKSRREDVRMSRQTSEADCGDHQKQ